MKKFIVFLMVFVMTITLTATINKRQLTIQHLYPRASIVTKTDDTQNIVTVSDNEGFIWTFCGVEDWRTGDGCNMLMYDNSTPDITDDIILQTIYYRQ